jgi:hypothetical protein
VSVSYVVGSRNATYTDGAAPPTSVASAPGTTTISAGWSVNDAPPPWSVKEVRRTMGLAPVAETLLSVVGV